MRRALFHLARWLVRASNAGATVASHLAAGTLRRADLAAAIRGEWEVFGATTRPATDGLLSWEEEFYGAHLRGGERVLLVGCGAGRDLVPFLERGHAVDGVDVAVRKLAECRQVLEECGLTARLVEGSVEHADLPGEYDVVIFSWYCYCYLPERAARLRGLLNVQSHLSPGGRILLSYVRRPAAFRRLPVWCARGAARLTGADWRPEPGDSFHLSSGGALHYEHQFAPEEFVEEANGAGLRVLWHELAAEGRAVLARSSEAS